GLQWISAPADPPPCCLFVQVRQGIGRSAAVRGELPVRRPVPSVLPSPPPALLRAPRGRQDERHAALPITLQDTADEGLGGLAEQRDEQSGDREREQPRVGGVHHAPCTDDWNLPPSSPPCSPPSSSSRRPPPTTRRPGRPLGCCLVCLWPGQHATHMPHGPSSSLPVQKMALRRQQTEHFGAPCRSWPSDRPGPRGEVDERPAV